MKLLQFVFIGLMLPATGSRQQHAVEGDWLTADGTAKVQIRPCETQYCGRIVWEKVSLQAKPTSAGASTQPAKSTNLGVLIIKEFTVKDNHTLSGGKLFDPDSKKWYNGQLKLLANGRLEVRGWVGIPAFGHYELWSRVP